MSAYYNEIDPYAAEWLRNLIKAGHIADGVVDERSIEDVEPCDLRGHTQCHFFAGIGVWSYALRNAGWADDRAVWTGSCPCQPFSVAGKGSGFADERHLWPAWHHLIRECRPAVVLGEQVASKDVGPWIDLVQDDMEALGHAFGAIPFPSAGVGAPHIRDRMYFVAYANDAGLEGRVAVRQRAAQRAARAGGLAGFMGDADEGRSGRHAGAVLGAQGSTGGGMRCLAGGAESASTACLMADAHGSACRQGCALDGGRPEGGDAQPRPGPRSSSVLGELADAGRDDWAGRLAESHGRTAIESDRLGVAGELADADGGHAGAEGLQRGGQHGLEPQDTGSGDGAGWAGPTNGFWLSADWLRCRDDKWRPVEPGTFPLANGATSRVGRLRAYGNAINAEAARVWVETVMESIA